MDVYAKPGTQNGVSPFVSCFGSSQIQRLGQLYTIHHPNIGTHLALRRAIMGEDPYVQNVPHIPGLLQA